SRDYARHETGQDEEPARGGTKDAAVGTTNRHPYAGIGCLRAVSPGDALRPVDATGSNARSGWISFSESQRSLAVQPLHRIGFATNQCASVVSTARGPPRHSYSEPPGFGRCS